MWKSVCCVKNWWEGKQVKNGAPWSFPSLFFFLIVLDLGIVSYHLPLVYKPLWNPLPSTRKSCCTEIHSKKEAVNFWCFKSVKFIVISTPFVSILVTNLFLNGGGVRRYASCHITVLYWKGTPVCELSIGLHQGVTHLGHLDQGSSFNSFWILGSHSVMVVFRIMLAKQMMQKCWAWSFNIFSRYICIYHGDFDTSNDRHVPVILQGIWFGHISYVCETKVVVCRTGKLKKTECFRND